MTLKKIKIVATVGPASRNGKIIRSLLKQGANVFRLNFSHGCHDDHALAIRIIREESKKLGVNAAVLADLQGPKIRTGLTAGDRAIRLKKGTQVSLTSMNVECTDRVISVDYPHLEAECKAGQRIMINDGAIRLLVLKVDRAGKRINCRVEAGGLYSSHKGVNLPGAVLSIPSLTRKDHADLEFILKSDVQYCALSFVRNAGDVIALRKIIGKKRKDLKIVAKIEKPEAAAAIEEILQAADGVMVARGDLGVEVSPFDVPVLQKDIVAKANAAGKLVIVATQMLESMIEHPLPTRAESSDVANAIFDGADAVMLSGETAVGSYPAEAVAMMSTIALTAESSGYYSNEIYDLCQEKLSPMCAIGEAAAWASHDLGEAPVCVFTLSGDTALYLSKIRNHSPIYAFSPNLQVVNALAMAWNVTSFYVPFDNHIADLMGKAEEILIQKKLVKKGSYMVIVSGTTPIRGATNSLRVKIVGQP